MHVSSLLMVPATDFRGTQNSKPDMHQRRFDGVSLVLRYRYQWIATNSYVSTRSYIDVAMHFSKFSGVSLGTAQFRR